MPYSKSFSKFVAPIVLAFLSISLSQTLSGDVKSLRNGGYGLYPEAKAPLDWSDTKNILWKIETPAWGNACPILVGERLIYTAEPAELICADARTGKILWRSSNSYEDVLDITAEERAKIKQIMAANENLAETLQPLERQVYQLNRRLKNDESNTRLREQLKKAEEEVEAMKKSVGQIPEAFVKPRTHDTNGYASMTPCTDGTYIYTCFGLGVVTKHDLDGNRIWGKVMEKPDHNWGAAVSPQLIGGKLIVRFSDYTALDPASGEELWRVENPVAFGPPAAFQLEGTWFLYTVRGELIRVDDGKKLKSQDWVIAQLTFAFFNTPHVQGNRVYAVHGAAGIQGDVYCMEIPATKNELETKGLKQIWHTEISKERYYTSPVVHEGLVYMMSMGNEFQVLDASTGELIYSEKVEGMKGRAFTGVLLIDDLLLVAEEQEVAVVIETGPTYKEVTRFNLGENRSTPIFDGDKAYLRTIEHLFAFQN